MSVTNVFAIFYVVAQVIERLVELLKIGLVKYDVIKANIETSEVKIEKLKSLIEVDCKKEIDLTEHYKTLNALIKEKNIMDNKMIWDFFIYTSILGILTTYIFNISFLSLLEVKVNPTLDLIITGLVIGSGTKPLHDLITYIQKPK